MIQRLFQFWASAKISQINVEIEVFRDSPEKLEQQIMALKSLLPKSLEITITDRYHQFSLLMEEQPSSAASPLELWQIQMERLRELLERAGYFTRHIVAKIECEEAEFVRIIEQADFIVIRPMRS